MDFKKKKAFAAVFLADLNPKETIVVPVKWIKCSSVAKCMNEGGAAIYCPRAEVMLHIYCTRTVGMLHIYCQQCQRKQHKSLITCKYCHRNIGYWCDRKRQNDAKNTLMCFVFTLIHNGVAEELDDM